MSKYNVGDKFILRIIKDDTMEIDTNSYYITNDGRLLEESELDKLQKYEEEQMPYSEAYNKGLNDAWELAKKLWYNDAKTNDDIYGIEYFIDIANEYTPQEALAKLEAYEKANEIKVGDIVYNDDTMEEGVVTHIDNDEVFMLYDDGSCGNTYGNLTKTGKHIDIQSVLKQIGSDADELS